MVKANAQVFNDKGIHARPSAVISSESQKFKSNVTLHYNGKTANSKDVLQIIILELFKNADVEIIAEGEDEQDACDAIKMLIEKQYDFD